MNPAGRIAAWLDERTGVVGFLRREDRRTVPAAGVPLYLIGEAALMLVAVQILTGILLSLYYVPTTDGAFESVLAITTTARFGRVVHAIHYWASHLLVSTLVGHIAASYALGAHRRPRELTWVSGWALLGLVLVFCFSGQVLRWDQQALAVAKVGFGLLGQVPLVGSALARAALGGGSLSSTTLSRMFTVHACALPLASGLLLGGHLLFVHVHNVTDPPAALARLRPGRLPLLRGFLPRAMGTWLVLANILLALALLFPPRLGQAASLFLPTDEHVEPEWYFLWLYETIAALPSAVGPVDGVQIAVVGAMVLFALGTLLPMIDPSGGTRRAAVVRTVALLVVVYLIAATALGSASPSSAQHHAEPEHRSDASHAIDRGRARIIR